MSCYEAVDVRVVTSLPAAIPIAGVVVKVLSQDGSQVYCQQTTDAGGLTQLLLPLGTYQVRFFKFGVSFTALLLAVLPSPAVNSFRVTGVPYVYPSATDRRLCVAAGVFRNPSGGLAASVDIHFIAKWSPIMLDGSPIMPERVVVRTDKRGYVEVPLIRYGQYDVTVEGMEDYQRTVSVPNTAAVNIGDLIFPVVSSITFDEEGPYTVATGETLVLHPHVYSSDLNEQPDITRDTLWSTTDSLLLNMVAEKTSISLFGVVAGTYELRAERKDQSIITIPNTPILGMPIEITVT